MKNTLAENMLRFGIKNLKESEVEKLQGLAEQSKQKTPMSSAGLVVNDMQLEIGAPPVRFNSPTGDKIVFNGTKDFDAQLAAESDKCVIYRYSQDKYIAMGMIGTFDIDSVTINSPGFKAILFRAIPPSGNDTIGAAVDKVIVSANTPYLVIATMLKALEPNIGSVASEYLTNDPNGNALFIGIINMYKMLGQMTDFDINNEEQLLDLANRVGKSKTINS